MKLNQKRTVIAVCLSYAALVAVVSTSSVWAQGESMANGNQLSMSLFPVQRGQDGQQYIITKAGFHVNVPGIGIAPDATEIAVYRDASNDYWYVNRTGQTVPVSHQQLQWVSQQISQQAQERGMMMPPGGVPIQNGYATQTQPVAQQPIIINNQQPSSSSSGSGAMTGLAAAGGAMAGAAIGSAMYGSNSSWGVPYGTPIYNQGDKYYYHGASGNQVYAPTTNTAYANQYKQQAQAYAANPQIYQNAYKQAYPQANGQNAQAYQNQQMQQQQQNEQKASQYHQTNQQQQQQQQQEMKSKAEGAQSANGDEGKGRRGRRHRGEDNGASKGAGDVGGRFAGRSGASGGGLSDKFGGRGGRMGRRGR